MKIATLYKITNIITDLRYYGIVYKKNKTILDRFEEHMIGKGGKILYEQGVLIHGRNNFKIETLCVGELYYIADLEIKLNKSNLWPIGYNGNTSHALILTTEQHSLCSAKKRARYAIDPTTKPIPPNWKGKKRSKKMRDKLSLSKMGHEVRDDVKEVLRLAATGKTWKQSTYDKINKFRKENLLSCCGRKAWLCISPEGVGHFKIGDSNNFFQILGLSYSSTILKNLNTDLPIVSKRSDSKSNGWIVYNDIDKITKIMKSDIEVIKYE